MRPIDADALKNEIRKYANEPSKIHDRRWDTRCTAIIADMNGLINEMPTIQPVVPRVMTLEEVFALRFDNVVYVEMYPALAVISAIVIDSIPWIRDELGILQIRCTQESMANMDFAWYGKTWRCWTARPTDEQREAAPWR